MKTLILSDLEAICLLRHVRQEIQNLADKLDVLENRPPSLTVDGEIEKAKHTALADSVMLENIQRALWVMIAAHEIEGPPPPPTNHRPARKKK